MFSITVTKFVLRCLLAGAIAAFGGSAAMAHHSDHHFVSHSDNMSMNGYGTTMTKNTMNDPMFTVPSTDQVRRIYTDHQGALTIAQGYEQELMQIQRTIGKLQHNPRDRIEVQTLQQDASTLKQDIAIISSTYQLGLN